MRTLSHLHLHYTSAKSADTPMARVTRVCTPVWENVDEEMLLAPSPIGCWLPLVSFKEVVLLSLLLLRPAPRLWLRATASAS